MGVLALHIAAATFFAACATRALADVLHRHSLGDIDPVAVCVDGSPAVYYWRESNSGSNLWVVNLEGGGWCDGAMDCRNRCAKKPEQCSSSNASSKVVERGLFHPRLDPAVLAANKVFLPYCTSDGHMGDAEALGGLQFRGGRVVAAVFKALTARHGLGSGSGRQLLILSGQSAGSRGAMVHLDYVSEMLGASAAKVDILGFLDSPLWMDLPPFPGSKFIGFGESTRRVHSYAQVRHLGSGCAAAYREEEQWRCLLGEYRMPFVRTPYLLVASQFDSYQLKTSVGHRPASSAELAYAEIFAHRTLQLVKQLRARWPTGAQRENAVLSWACYTHATSLKPGGFDREACGVNGTTLDKALKKFLEIDQGPRGSLEWIDNCTGFACGAGCNGESASAAASQSESAFVFV